MAEMIRESRRIAVGRGAAPTAEAMDTAESFVKSLDLDEKATLRMRLLAEEVVELLRTTADGFSGLFWLEADGSECRICIDGSATLSLAAEENLVSVSSDGRNASVRGFTAKLSQFARHYKEYIARLDAVMSLSSAVCAEDYLYIGALMPGKDTADVSWSMNDYRKLLLDDMTASAQIAADRDELEKSILGNLADDVRVGVKEDRIRITVVKKL